MKANFSALLFIDLNNSMRNVDRLHGTILQGFLLASINCFLSNFEHSVTNRKIAPKGV
jgi:hypothetical protein